MNLKVGDKVSFLNEKRDGIVKKIMKDGLVSVEIEHGFEIPVLSKELIRIGSDGALDVQAFIEEKKANYETQKEVEAEVADESPIAALNTDDAFVKSGLFISFVPIDKGLTPKEGFNVLLVNKTDYDVLFACYHKKKDTYLPITYDAVSKQSSYHLQLIEADELEQWCRLHFHVLYFAEEGLPVRPPLEKDFQLDPAKLFKENACKYLKILGTHALIHPLHEEVKPLEWEEELWENDKIESVPVRNIKEMIKDTETMAPMNKRHVVAPYIAEVDLHIEELTDNTASLKNHEKLNIQIAYFSKCLDTAIVHKFKKITFIHGVGNGRLKEEILKIINESYSGIRIQDAPLSKYGKGATEVLIPFNLSF